MRPHLFEIPYFVLALVAGGVVGFTLSAEFKRVAYCVLSSICLAALGALIGYVVWGTQTVPVQGYGTMILLGFIVAVWLGARRAPQIGVEPRHIADIGIFGVVTGLSGARLLHVIVKWNDPDYAYNPFQPGGFEPQNIANWFMLWKGGLVFYGTLLVVVPGTWYLCRRMNIPPLKCMDLVAPTLIVGLAFGRIGCLLNGCCYGKPSSVPWAIEFPRHLDPDGTIAGAPAYVTQLRAGLVTLSQTHSLPVHPTQIYAALAAGLTAAFLYAYWPHRKYDGQILSLMLIMAGTTRFFEELLRADEGAPLPGIATWMTLAQWLAIGIVLAGCGLLMYFRGRRTALSSF